MVSMEMFVFTTDGIQQLHEWAHASISIVLDHLSTFPAADYQKELPGFGFSTLQKQVVHIFNCEGFWIHVIKGLPYVDRDPATCSDVADARLLQQQVSRWTEEYLLALSNQQLNSDAELRFPDGDFAVRTPALVLHHVLTHAFHHKGQIAAMCRQLGRPMPDTDLNQFK
jgi:uncharacterized damage-inducible protein DinB